MSNIDITLIIKFLIFFFFLQKKISFLSPKEKSENFFSFLFFLFFFLFYYFNLLFEFNFQLKKKLFFLFFHLQMKDEPFGKEGDEEEKPGPHCCTFLPFDIYPWFILVTVCFITFGSYWCFDTPGAIYKQLRLWFGPEWYDQSKNLLLYSVYSYPNVVLAFFGGFIIDRITGVRLGAIIFCSLVLTGQTVFAIGVQSRSYWLAVLGRFIFGLGGESLTVAQNTFCARWAPESMMALWFGIVVSCSRIGSSINFVVTPKLAAKGVPISVWTGVATCVFSMTMCLSTAALDYAGRARIKKDTSEEPPQLKGVLKFKLPVWILFLICVFFYGAVLTFYTVASNIMQNTGYMYSAQAASSLLAIPNLVAIVGCPYFGWFVGQHGRALVCLIFASLMLVVTHLCFLGNAVGKISMWWGMLNGEC
jgi:MFS family permease